MVKVFLLALMCLYFEFLGYVEIPWRACFRLNEEEVVISDVL